VVGLVRSNDPESYAGSSDATGMASLARLVKGSDPDQKGYPGPPGWGLGMRLTVSPSKTYIKSANHCYFHIHNHAALILLS